MTDILQIFSGNPLTTFIGKKIEAATRPELESEDWSLNMEICDIINENDDDAKDAVRAIKKRLQLIEQDRNFTITNRTLTILETCVSNCSHRFHLLVMTKDFIQDLVKLIGPKNNPPIDLQERVLRLIERWAEAFRPQPDLGGVVAVYNDLKAKGVTFPTRDPASNVPIQTPQRSVPAAARQETRSAHFHDIPQPVSGGVIAAAAAAGQLQQPAGQIVLEGDGYNKISQDLTVVQSSIEMFTDIMKVLESSENLESDWKLAADLNTTCRQMKDRIVDLIERVANEDLTIELLRLNDDLNNIFTKYDRLVKNKSKSTTTTQQSDSGDVGTDRLVPTTTTMASSSGGVSSRTLNDLSLIDFNAEDSSAASNNASREPVAATSKPPPTSTTPADPFDTSNIIPQAGIEKQVDLIDGIGRLNLGTKSASSAMTSDKKSASGLPEEISSVREQDFAEIENWLSTDSGGRDPTSTGGVTSSMEPISIPNSEFENFIASRALAGSKTNPSSAHSSQQKSNLNQEPST